MVNYLDNVELVCMAYGVPLPNITWSSPECDDLSWNCNYTSAINVTDLVINYGGVQFRKSVLQFCSVQELDTNVYTCWADNGISGPGIAVYNRSIALTVNITTTGKQRVSSVHTVIAIFRGRNFIVRKSTNEIFR